MAFLVTSVIDGDTFDVKPRWKFNGRTGDRVRIAKFDAPEMDSLDGIAAKLTLEALIDGQSVELYPEVVDIYRRLVAEVRLNGKDITLSL